MKLYYPEVSYSCNYLIAHPELSASSSRNLTSNSMFHGFIPFCVFPLPLLLSHLMCGTNTALSSTSLISALVLLQCLTASFPLHICTRNLMI